MEVVVFVVATTVLGILLDVCTVVFCGVAVMGAVFSPVLAVHFVAVVVFWGGVVTDIAAVAGSVAVLVF